MNEFWEVKVDCTVDGRLGKALSVKWICELEEREWGFKSMSIRVPAQYIVVHFENDTDPDLCEEEIEYFVDEFDVRGADDEIPLRLCEIQIVDQKVIAYF